MVSWLNLVTNHWIMSKDEVNIDLNGGFFFFPSTSRICYVKMLQ